MIWLFVPCLVLASLLSVGHADFFLSLMIGLTGLAGAWQLASGRWQMGAFPAPLSWMFLAFGLWAGLSTLWSDAPFDSWRALSVWLLLPVWAWMFASLDLQKLKPVFASAIAVIFALVLIAYLQIAGGSPYAGYRPPSLFANPNTFASLLVAIILPLQYLWLARESAFASQKFVRWGVAVILIVLFGGLVLTASRIAMLGYLGFTLFSLWQLRGMIYAHRKEFIAFFAGLGVMYLTMNFLADNVMTGRLSMIADEALSRVRFLVYDTAWQSYLQAPMTGHGFGALHVSYASLRHVDDNTLGQFAHSDVLQYLAELGPLGLLLSVSIFGFFIWMSFSRLREGFKNADHRIWFVALTVGITATAMASTVTYLFYLPVILLMHGLMLGMWASIFWSEEEALPIKRNPAGGVAYLVVAGLLTCLHVSAVMTTQAAESIMKYSMKDHYKWNMLASRLSFDLNPQVLLEWADVSQSFTSQDKEETQIKDLENTLDRLERLQPGLPQLWLLRGRFALIHDDTQAAEAHFRQAVALDPVFLPGRLMLGRLLRELGRGAEADALYEEGLKYALIPMKYDVKNMDDLKEREKNLPRLTKSR